MPKAKHRNREREVKKPTVSSHVIKSETMDIERLIPYAKNSKQHSPEQIKQIADSIARFGFTNPVLVWKNNEIIAGHGRTLGAQLLIDTGKPEYQYLKKIPVRRCDHMTDAERRAYTIADNKLAEGALWDDAMLAGELKALLDDDFPIDLTGFDEEEAISIIDEELEIGGEENNEDDIPAIPKKPITRKGDIIVLGNHRLMCGDATSLSDIDKLLEGTKIDMAYCDPPYGVSIVQASGKVATDRRGSIGAAKPVTVTGHCAPGKDNALGPMLRGKVGGIHRGMKAKPIIKSGVYEQIIGDDTTDTAVNSYTVCVTLGIKKLIFWGGNYYADKLPPSSCWIIWDKENGESFFADAEVAWTNFKTAIRIFKHKWNGLIKASERGEKRVHPTQKPIALAEWCFENYAKNDKTILDLFGGSGSTLMACEKSKKRGYIMELSPHYCDVIALRWENFTGKKAVRLPRD